MGTFCFKLNLVHVVHVLDLLTRVYVCVCVSSRYEPEQWTGLYYRLPVDPTKTLADLMPSYAARATERVKRTGEQWSTDEFLQQGEYALHGGNGLNYYNTTGTAGARATKGAGAGAGAKGTLALRVLPSLSGQVLMTTIYASGRFTITGARREKDVHDVFLRLFDILKQFALSVPPECMPQPPPVQREFLPGQRRLMRQEMRAAEARNHDVKPAYLIAAAQNPVVNPAALSRPNLAMPIINHPLRGTFTGPKTEPVANTALKSEPGSLGATLGSAIILEGLPEEAVDIDNEDVDWE
jgi:hypothetical protein